MNNAEQDTRYPYTYAADYIRGIAGYNKEGTKLSRADASAIIKEIAEKIGQDRETIAKRLADAELDKTEDDYARQMRGFLEQR